MRRDCLGFFLDFAIPNLSALFYTAEEIALLDPRQSAIGRDEEQRRATWSLPKQSSCAYSSNGGRCYFRWLTTLDSTNVVAEKIIITKCRQTILAKYLANFLQNRKCKCAWSVPWQMQEKTCQVHDYNLPCPFYSVPLLSKTKLLSHKGATLVACPLARSTSQYIL